MTQLEAFRDAWIEYHSLADQVDAAWGDRGDGKSAKPLAIQLGLRIRIGEMMLGDNADPGYQRVVKRKLLTLQRDLARAQADPLDVARCYEFTQLAEQHERALDVVAGLYDQAKETLGDDGIRALVARDRGDGATARVAEPAVVKQTSLFFAG